MSSSSAATLLILTILFSAPVRGDEGDLGGLSLDDLLAVKVSVASRHEQTVRRAPGSLAIITGEDIERFGYRTLAEALASVPGLFLGYDRNYTYLGVRGFGRPSDYNNRVLVMIEGHRLNEDFYGFAPLGQDLPLDLRAVERIEVVRGPGSASFGAGAMLATVNIVLKRSNQLADNRLVGEAGTFGRQSGSLLLGKDWAGDRGILVTAVGTDVDGEVAADGESSRGAFAALDWGGFRLLAFGTDSEKRFPTGAFDTVPGDPRNRTIDRWSGLDLRYQRAFEPHLTVQARGAVGSYAYEGDYAYETGMFFDSTDDEWWSGEAELAWAPRSDSRLVVGASTRRVTRSDYLAFDDFGVYFDGDFPYDLNSFYAEEEYQPNERWVLTLGLRHDDYSRAGSSTNPRFAAVFIPTTNDTFKLLYGRAFRPPNVYETDYASDLYQANPNLEPETIQTVEAIWERRLSSIWHASAGGYVFEIEDLIDQVEDADGFIRFHNVSGASGRGVDLEIKGRWSSGWTASAGASLQRTVEKASDARLTNSPSEQVKLALSAPLGSAFRLSGSLLYETSRRTVQDTRTDAYWLANTNLSYRPARWPVDVELQVRNLLDESYAYPGGLEHRQDSIAQDGRTYAIRLGFRF